jgi:hypothetical protein
VVWDATGNPTTKEGLVTLKHHAAQYNLVAKKLRDNFPTYNTELAMAERTIISRLALDFAKSFQADNPNFDPYTFLDRCSPDADLYPLSELWEEQ